MCLDVRLAVQEDHEEIMHLLRLLYKGDVGEGLCELVREYLDSTSHVVLLAQRGDTILGLVIGTYRLDIDYECRAGFIDAIVVTESERDHGVGRALMGQFAQWARQRGCSVLQVINPNEGFFAAVGFTHRKARLWQAPIGEART